MTYTAVVDHIPIEARLAAAKNERESERLRLEKLKSRLRKKMEAAAGEKNDPNNERLLPH
jgi:hypothetical protein